MDKTSLKRAKTHLVNKLLTVVSIKLLVRVWCLVEKSDKSEIQRQEQDVCCLMLQILSKIGKVEVEFFVSTVFMGLLGEALSRRLSLLPR